jgi:Tfp pilus assembly protein PilF
METQHFGTQDKVWLVKSSGKVLGPYSIEEILFLLERRKVSIIDEIRSPRKRWGFIREDPVFAKIVETLREEDAKLLDNTTEIDSKTRTVITTTFNEDETATPVREGSIIITPGNIPPPSSAQQTVPKPANQQHRPTPNERMPKMEVFRSDEMGHKNSKSKSTLPPIKLETTTNWGLFIGIAIVLGLGYAGYNSISKQAPATKQYSDEDYILIAANAKKIGLYEKSMGIYKILESRGKLDQLSSINMAILSIDSGSSPAEARKRLETIIPSMNAGDPVRTEAQVAIGVSYLKEGNTSKADETFQAVLFSNESNKDARLNLGLSKILSSDPRNALKELNVYQRDGGLDGLATLGKVIANWAISDGQNDTAKNKSVVDELDRYINNNSEYRLEALLLKATALQKMGDKDASQRVAKNLLDEDPQLSLDHSHNLIVDRQIIRWDRLNMYCDYLAVKWGDSAIAKSLTAFCYAQKMDYTASLTKLTAARKLLPKNNMLLSLEAWMNLKQKRINEAQQLAMQAESDSVLSQRVLALACEEIQNWDCADQKWRRILLGNGQDLGALRGMANYQLLRNHPDQSLEFIKKGKTISENYRPLIEIKDKIDAH